MLCSQMLGSKTNQRNTKLQFNYKWPPETILTALRFAGPCKATTFVVERRNPKPTKQ
jgi:hypothetical protein